MDALIFPLGMIAVALVVLRLAVLTVTSVSQAAARRKHGKLSLQLLVERIEAVRRQRETNALAWNGYRKFEIDRIVDEAERVRSFYLVPHDGKPLPTYQAGQYLTFRLNIPGREKPVVRCYSLSDCPRPDHFRITVKCLSPPANSPAAPPGLVSSFFHEQLRENDILDVQAPRGNFVLNPDDQRPAVLIAGGVGVTPILSMMSTIAENKSDRELLCFYGVRNGAAHAFRTELDALAENHANMRLVVCYSQPAMEDEAGEGTAFHHRGRTNIELIKSYLPSTNYQFYICGPPAMIESLTQQLAKWGVAERDVFSEAFGPATVSKKSGKPLGTKPAAAATASEFQITFAKSDKICTWNAAAENLLDFALDNGVEIDSGCRAGNCGTCVAAIKSGQVSYLAEHGAELEEGTCLTCIAAPAADLTLDA